MSYPAGPIGIGAGHEAGPYEASGDSPPSFTSVPITNVRATQAYSYSVTTTDPEADTITLTAPVLPSWMTFTDNGDGTGTLSGTPEKADSGDNAVTLRATDKDGSTDQSFTAHVRGFGTVLAHKGAVQPPQYVWTSDSGDPRVRVRSTTAYTSPAKDNPNYVPSSENMPAWASYDTVNTLTNKYLTINGKRIRVCSCEDDDAARYEQAASYNYIPITPGDEVHFSFFCLKDSVPATTRHPMLRAYFSGGSARAYDLNWATDMGVAATANVTYSNWGVEEKTDDNGTEYLHVWGSIAAPASDNNTAFTFILYPAVGNSATLTTYSAAAVGSIDITGWIMNAGAVTEAPEYFGPTSALSNAGLPDYFYDNGVTPNVIYMTKGAGQLSKILDLARRVKMVRTKAFAIARNILRTLTNR